MNTLKTPLLLAGLCLATASNPGAPVACPDNPCGTAVILWRGEPGTLFAPSFGRGPQFAIGDLIYLKLADLGPSVNTFGDSGFIPRLASTWRWENPLTLTFRLNPRARWQDGRPVTAQDVAFTFDVFKDTLVNAPARPLLDAIESVTVRDAGTVTFRFRRAYAEGFYDATHHMRMIPKHLLDTIPRNRLAAHPIWRMPVGAGPYRLVSWKPGESVELAADSSFFLGRPGLARLIFRLTPDLTVAISQLLAGEADFMEYLGSPENADRLAGSEMRVFEYPANAYIYLDLNLWDPNDLTKPHPLFGDRELRRALFQAIDRRKLVEVAYGRYGYVAVGPVSASQPLGRDTTIPQLRYDTAAARRSLAGLGWRDTDNDGILDRAGQRLEFEVIFPASSEPRRRAFVVLQDQLKRIGVGLKPVHVDFTVMGDRTEHRRFDASIMNWIDDPSPSSLRQTFITEAIGGSNFRGYSNPEFDRLVAAAMAEPDRLRARGRWRDAYALLNQDVPGIWLAAPIQFGGVHRRFENVTFRPDQWTATLWTWRVTRGRGLPRDLVESRPGSR